MKPDPILKSHRVAGLDMVALGSYPICYEAVNRALRALTKLHNEQEKRRDIK